MTVALLEAILPLPQKTNAGRPREERDEHGKEQLRSGLERTG
jgi:hypothetical protein